MPTTDAGPSNELRLARALWGALFASTLLYLVVLELVTPEANTDWKMLAPMFAFGAAGAAGASLVAPRLTERSSGSALVGLILALALAESVCILGMVLGFLGAPAAVVVPFFVATWVLMLVRFPTRERLERSRRRE